MKRIVPVEVSARHVHLSQDDLVTLFGKDFKLEVVKDLSQPGQFLSNARVEIIGPKKSLVNVSVLGPTRNSTQVEVSATDARQLGVKAPIRESGVLVGSAPIKIKGPHGEVELDEGLIVAKRHIHITSKIAKEYNVENGQIVQVLVEGCDRRTIYDDVVVRVSDSYALAMHIDTDEGNAASVCPGLIGEIIK